MCAKSRLTEKKKKMGLFNTNNSPEYEKMVKDTNKTLDNHFESLDILKDLKKLIHKQFSHQEKIFCEKLEEIESVEMERDAYKKVLEDIRDFYPNEDSYLYNSKEGIAYLRERARLILVLEEMKNG